MSALQYTNGKKSMTQSDLVSSSYFKKQINDLGNSKGHKLSCLLWKDGKVSNNYNLVIQTFEVSNTKSPVQCAI